MATTETPPPAGVPIAAAQLDIMLPSQFFGPPLKHAPERRLLVAVLIDALDCLEKYRLATNKQGRRLFWEAKQWFLADEVDFPYSFEWICAALDLDSNAVRARLGVCPESQPVAGLRTGLLQSRDLGLPKEELMSAGPPESTGQAVPRQGSQDAQNGSRATGSLSARLLTVDTDRKMADMERVLLTAGNHADQMDALVSLRSWQLDSRLDSATRQRANALVWRFQPNGWDEV